jgi:hypothetical protein
MKTSAILSLLEEWSKAIVMIKYFRTLHINWHVVLLAEEEQFSDDKGGQHLKPINHLDL